MSRPTRQGRRTIAHTHINSKLRINLGVFVVITLALVGVVVVETVRSRAEAWQVVAGLLIGIGLGVIFARTFKLSWDATAEQVVSSVDRYGIFILVLYIIFNFSRQSIVHWLVHDTGAAAISWALLAGTMYGRVVGSGRVIVRILRERRVFARG